MITVPQPTIEKPITVVDYIAAMYQQCITVADVARFAEQCPSHVREDERFATGVALHLRVIAARRRKA